MATLKIVLRKKKNKDGTYPLSLRITSDRKSSYISLQHHVHLTDWDATGQRVRKSHPNAARLNNLLLKKKAEANDKLLEMVTRNEDISSKVIGKQIKPNNGNSFFEQARIFTDNLKKNGKYNRYTTDIGRIERFKEFLGGETITFPEITVTLLNQFRS